MRILVTGGAGFIGSHCVDALRLRGHDVSVLDKDAHPAGYTGNYIQADLRDRREVDRAVRGQDVVLHAAGILGTHETVDDIIGTSSINILGGLNVLEAIHAHGCRLVNISKPNVWLNPYSITKDCIEKYCSMYVNEFDAQIAVVKMFNVYGPRQKYSGVQKAIPTWIINALNDRPVQIFGSGCATMDLVHVYDAALATVAMIENFEACRLRRESKLARDIYSTFSHYNEQMLEIGSGVEVSVRDVVAVLERILRKTVQIEHLPMRKGEIDGTRLCANIEPLASRAGFRPAIATEAGLRETIDYYRRNQPQFRSGESGVARLDKAEAI